MNQNNERNAPIFPQGKRYGKEGNWRGGEMKIPGRGFSVYKKSRKGNKKKTNCRSEGNNSIKRTLVGQDKAHLRAGNPERGKSQKGVQAAKPRRCGSYQGGRIGNRGRTTGQGYQRGLPERVTIYKEKTEGDNHAPKREERKRGAGPDRKLKHAYKGKRVGILARKPAQTTPR